MIITTESSRRGCPRPRPDARHPPGREEESLARPSIRSAAELLPLLAPYPAGKMILEVVAPQACLV